MFGSAHNTPFSLFVEGRRSDFQVLSFKGREAISQPFQLDLELVSESASLPLEKLQYQLVFLQFAENGAGIHGRIYRIAKGESGKRLTHYQITLRPHLSWLAYRTNQRIFQHLSVPKIIAQVLEEHGILGTDYQFLLRATYPEREYCVQYDESDLYFIQRLCEEEGIHYHFRHSLEAHQLVFGDDPGVFPRLAPVTYKPESGLVADTPVVKRFSLRLEPRSNLVTLRDYSFKTPLIALEDDAKSAAKPQLEHYRYLARSVDNRRGWSLATRLLERHRSDVRQASGASDQPLLVSGHCITLTEHPDADWNCLWLLTAITHEGYQPQVLEELCSDDFSIDPGGFRQGYRNEFTVTPWDATFRPALDHPKPLALSLQTAVVTGPEGEEIYCDEYGRVKVRFFWDRNDQPDEYSSCWIRVGASWAGQGWGAVSLPRVGMEVLVSFLENDPDQPLITGCVYHELNRATYRLPDFKTLATLRSKEYKGKRGNELRIDDTTREISIALRSDHGASALNLGYLTHPRPFGGQPRGEGFELRTDHHGAVRAAGGLLVTTEARAHEARHHKDLPETAERLFIGSELQDGFATLARENQAQDPDDQDDVAKALLRQHQGILGTFPGSAGNSEFPEFVEPHLVLASPAGIALTTSGSTHLATGEHLAVSSSGHSSFAIGKRLLVSASRGMRLFVQNLGWRLVAASGDIDVRALKDSINLLAKLNITATADRITLTAKTELVIQAGGSASTYNAGGITHATAGNYIAQASTFAYSGPNNRAAAFPEPLEPGPGSLELFNRYTNRQGIKGAAFDVIDALGNTLTGALDAKGFSAVAGAASGPATVLFKADPADTWREGSYWGKPGWLSGESAGEGLGQSVKALANQVLPVVGRPIKSSIENLIPGEFVS